MSTLAHIAKNAQHILRANSPVILTGFAVAGVLTTTILAVRVTPEAHRRLEQERFERGVDLLPDDAPDSMRTPEVKLGAIDTIRIAGPLYVPALLSGVTTAGCILGAHSIHTARQAAALSAYTVVNKSLEEYREKFAELVGEKKATTVRDEINQRTLDENPVGSSEVIMIEGGEVLCFDKYGGRYFMSTMQKLRAAENAVNSMLVNEMYASLNDWYSQIGLPHTTAGAEFGWRAEKLMELEFTSGLATDDRPCLVVMFRNNPEANFWKAFG